MNKDQHFKPQVGSELYFGKSYMNPGRFASYGYQLQEIMALQPGKTLEVGIGNGVVCCMLRKAGVDLTTVDFDESLGPDIVAGVTELPFEDNTFDIGACFEVLEHLPYEMLCKALCELHRICRGKVIISLPDAKPILFRIRIPKLGAKKYLIPCPFVRPRSHKFKGQHHWEINKAGYPLKRIKKDINSCGFIIESTYRAWENPLHRFFRLVPDKT